MKKIVIYFSFAILAILEFESSQTYHVSICAFKLAKQLFAKRLNMIGSYL